MSTAAYGKHSVTGVSRSTDCGPGTRTITQPRTCWRLHRTHAPVNLDAGAPDGRRRFVAGGPQRPEPGPQSVAGGRYPEPNTDRLGSGRLRRRTCFVDAASVGWRGRPRIRLTRISRNRERPAAPNGCQCPGDTTSSSTSHHLQLIERYALVGRCVIIHGEADQMIHLVAGRRPLTRYRGHTHHLPGPGPLPSPRAMARHHRQRPRSDPRAKLHQQPS